MCYITTEISGITPFPFHVIVMTSEDFFNVDRRSIDAQAKNLLSKLAREEASDFIHAFDENDAKETISKSIFAAHVVNFPHKYPELVLSFNLYLTRKAIDYICSHESNPFVLPYLASRILELSGYTFVDPHHPGSTFTYLSPSKLYGYFFTPPEISFFMAKNLLLGSDTPETVLDPCAGCGSLLSAVLLVSKNIGVQVDNITGIEIDPVTSVALSKVLNTVKSLVGSVCEIKILNVDALDLLSCNNSAEPITSLRFYTKVIMNPPYGRLRFLKSSLTNKETRADITRSSMDDLDKQWKSKMSVLSDKLRNIGRSFGLSEGIQDYPRIFLLLSLSKLRDGGRLAIISPDSWLGDRASLEMRKAFIENRWIEEVITFREDARLFDTVNQATAVTFFRKHKRQRHISISFGLEEITDGHHPDYVPYRAIAKMDPQWLRIPRINMRSIKVYDQLLSHATIGKTKDLVNSRGEVDLSFYKNLITSDSSEIRLIRGDHIERYIVRTAESSKREGYLKKNEFLKRFSDTPKFQDFLNFRVVGRQCSYFQKLRRLSFAMVEPEVAVSNSCNYLCFKSEEEGTMAGYRLWALLGLLNSAVMEWYFRVFNSNNHVANYEIETFPICLGNMEYVKLLSKSAQLLYHQYSNTQWGGKTPSPIEDFHDALVSLSYGLSPDMVSGIMETVDAARSSRVVNILKCLYEGMHVNDLMSSEGWVNHTLTKLSDLDLSIIKNVPQGGNWQNVPENIPSKRLDQIREMTKRRGIVRTTYYGRLRPDQPAYTIATYFNRPGNGTNIHPFECRTISAREAARLQSFPDSYFFIGSQTAIRNQIGNAVPPLLAYAVGKSIAKHIGLGKCVDIFSGAGGLSLGLELAGWDILLAVDNDNDASKTYRFNRPCSDLEANPVGNTVFIQGDLFQEDAYERTLSIIRKRLKGKGLDLLVGGPPCQGFSHAGWRNEQDRRNDLTSVYLNIVEKLKPKVVLMENVEGILTLKNGQVIKDLTLTLRELGYTVAGDPWVLLAEQYGVPQMRRRVFVVASRDKKMLPEIPKPLFKKCSGRREKVEQFSLFPSLPRPINVEEAFYGLKALAEESFGNKALKGIRKEYSDWAKGLASTEEMLASMTGR